MRGRRSRVPPAERASARRRRASRARRSPPPTCASRPAPLGPSRLLASTSSSATVRLPSSSSTSWASCSLIRRNAPLAQIPQHVALLVRLVLESLQRPSRPQARTERAVARRRSRGAQTHLRSPHRDHERRVRGGRDRARRRQHAGRPRDSRAGRRGRALDPQHDVPEADLLAGQQPPRLGQRLAGNDHAEPRSGVLDHRGRRDRPRSGQQARHGPVVELERDVIAAADRHRVRAAGTARRPGARARAAPSRAATSESADQPPVATGCQAGCAPEVRRGSSGCAGWPD